MSISEEHKRPRSSGDYAQRGCLKCSKSFLSSGPGNRICPTCRSGAHYQTPPLFESVPDIPAGAVTEYKKQNPGPSVGVKRKINRSFANRKIGKGARRGASGS